MAITNPDDVIDVRGLAHFEGNLQGKYAQQSVLKSMRDAIATITQDKVSENEWNGMLMWNGSLVWPTEQQSKQLNFINDFYSAFGWVGAIPLNGSATWPDA